MIRVSRAIMDRHYPGHSFQSDGDYVLVPPGAVQAASVSGPGYELKRVLASIGIRPGPGCKCNARAAKMDAMGCDWCEQNIQTIVCWLREEHARQKMLIPFSSLAAEQLVKLAIRRARKKGIK